MTQTLAWKKTAVMIHLGFMAGLLVYGVVVWLVIPRIELSPAIGSAGAFSNMRYVFFGTAVLVVLAVRRLPRLLGPKRDLPDEVNSARRLRASIVTSALCEIPAVLGLVLVILTGSQRDFLYLSGLSVVFFLIYFPRDSSWEGA